MLTTSWIAELSLDGIGFDLGNIIILGQSPTISTPTTILHFDPLQSSVVVPDKNQFQHILRLLNTNIDGKRKIMYSLTHIKGVGRRFANLVCKKADVNLNKR
jgi:hypothetical protein